MWRVQVSMKLTRLATTQTFLDFACLCPRTRDEGVSPSAALCALALFVRVAPRVEGIGGKRIANCDPSAISYSCGTSMAES